MGRYARALENGYSLCNVFDSISEIERKKQERNIQKTMAFYRKVGARGVIVRELNYKNAHILFGLKNYKRVLDELARHLERKIELAQNLGCAEEREKRGYSALIQFLNKKIQIENKELILNSIIWSDCSFPLTWKLKYWAETELVYQYEFSKLKKSI